MAENKDVKNIEKENGNPNGMNKKKGTLKRRTVLVLVFIALFLVGAFISYNVSYIETLEIGEEYLEVFSQNIKYRLNIGIINFIVIFMIVYITNGLIKKGLRQFFEEEKREMPKLPNKSLALVIATVTSIVVSGMFLQKTILFMNATQFGISDPMFNMDVGFYMFRTPLIGQLLYYGVTMMIMLTIYTVVYYLVVFNMFFEGIDGQTLRNNTFIKQLLFNVMIIAIFIASIIFFNVQNMETGGFLTLGDKMKTILIGAGSVDGIKMWGYRVLGALIIIVVYIAIKAFKKNNTKKVIEALAVVPIYLVGLFVVMFGYNLLFVSGSELEKQKPYITTNINFTKIAYDIKTDEVQLKSADTITDEQAENNQDVINNIPIITEDVAINNLLQTQTKTGYYTYSKAKAALYNENLAYIAAREIDSNNETEEYTHGYGAVIASATETDESGNIKYIARDFENESIKEPRIYYGTENTKAVSVSKNLEEFDYPLETKQNVTYSYEGEGGISLNLLDRICVAIKEGNFGLVLTDKDGKILLNRNVVKRAERIIPYLLYDEEPYLIISDSGELYWVIDAYTVSNDFPYSQKSKFVYKNDTKEINYIRNSVKVVVNAFNGDTKFYITDKTDPIAMVYNNMYSNLFEDVSNIPSGISKYFTYSEFLYNIQAEVLELYHDVSADVLYRGNDVWEIASYSSLITRTAATEMKPYFTSVKLNDSDESVLGLVTAYNQSGKESLNAYLIGTVENGKNKLSLYRFTGDSTVLGPMQLDSLIEQDETISAEISALNVTGTKITKEMVIVPIDDTLLYVVPIYQTSLNEINSVPVLKKVVVASGNKIAIGDNLTRAIRNLLSPTSAVSIEVEDNSTIEGLIESIIKANNNLTESNDSNNWEQIGRDIEALQTLVKQLEMVKASENANESVNDDKNNVNENNVVNTGGNNVVD